MRCIITYKRGPFIGSLEIGVANETDPKIAEACKGLDVISIRFW